ncbi:hypothetical protein B0O99DRAFT_694778 [Bisporella sp. PMI_857]|nr:hypothetical protein B0O99DRAFT_694778 [Bisporella sp. PMI_857]
MAGLDPQYVHAGTRSGPERNRLPSVSRQPPQISADGEFEGCLKSFPIPVREGLAVMMCCAFYAGTTRYILVNGDGRRWRISVDLYQLKSLRERGEATGRKFISEDCFGGKW